jgi:photosystem II stability/assembly factor-like uncharacterized protein
MSWLGRSRSHGDASLDVSRTKADGARMRSCIWRRASIALVLLSALLFAPVGVAAARVARPPAAGVGDIPAVATRLVDAYPAWPPSSLTSVCFVNADDGWLTATVETPDGGGGEVLAADRVYATTDGGATWRLQFGASKWYVFDLRPLFLSRTIGWAFGRSLFGTRDGGAHWRRSAIAPLGFWTEDLQAPSTGVLWAQCFYDPDSSMTEVMRSTDSGKSWKQVRLYTGGARLAAFTSKRAVLAGLLLAGLPGHVASLTTDAGRSWRRVWRCPGDVWGMVSRGPKSAWMWGDWGIAHSADGGGTWRRVSHYSPRAIACGSSSSCWAVGSDAVWRTLDGGASWSSFSPPWAASSDSVSIGSVQFINDRVGWVVESDSRLWRTLDGGAKWTLLLSL